MELQKRTMALRVLRAAPGHKLTADGRYFTDTVYLGSQADPAQWREVTDAEAEAILAEQNAEIDDVNDTIPQSLTE